jgi:hypothetical protein
VAVDIITITGTVTAVMADGVVAAAGTARGLGAGVIQAGAAAVRTAVAATVGR